LRTKTLTRLKNELMYYLNEPLVSIDVSNNGVIIYTTNKSFSFHSTPIDDKNIIKMIEYAENNIEKYTYLDVCGNSFRIKNISDDIKVVINSREVDMTDYNEVISQYVDLSNMFSPLFMVNEQVDIDYYIDFLVDISKVINTNVEPYVNMLLFGSENKLQMAIDYSISDICLPLSIRIKVGRDFIRLQNKYDVDFYRKILSNINNENISIYDKCQYKWATVRDVVRVKDSLYINYMGEPVKLPKYWLVNSYSYKDFKVNIKRGIIFTSESLYNILISTGLSFRSLTSSDFIIDLTKFKIPGVDKIILKDGKIVGVVPLYRLLLSENKFLFLKSIVDSIFIKNNIKDCQFE